MYSNEIFCLNLALINNTKEDLLGQDQSEQQQKKQA